MAYYKDLTDYEYSIHPFRCAGKLYNVGWLERTARYTDCDVEPDLAAKLLALCKWPVNRYRGWHKCHFCQEYPVRVADSDGEFCLGDGEIRVVASDGMKTYAAPSLIYHYVASHRYLPPSEFLLALREMPLQSPGVVWALEAIESFQQKLMSPDLLLLLLARIGKGDRPPLPLDARAAILAAKNELRAATGASVDGAQRKVEVIVESLKSTLENLQNPPKLGY